MIDPARTPRPLFVLIGTFLGFGCATPASPVPSWTLASASPRAGHELKLLAGGQYAGLSIVGDQMVSPTRSLIHRPGVVRGQGLEVLIDGDAARGHTDSAPVTLLLDRSTIGVVRVRGSLGFKYVDFRISPAALIGVFGGCSYQLSWNGSRYDGVRDCGASPWTWLELPGVMAGWSDAEVATVLSIVL